MKKTNSRNSKRLLATLLAFALACSLALTAFASGLEEETQTTSLSTSMEQQVQDSSQPEPETSLPETSLPETEGEDEVEDEEGGVQTFGAPVLGDEPLVPTATAGSYNELALAVQAAGEGAVIAITADIPMAAQLNLSGKSLTLVGVGGQYKLTTSFDWHMVQNGGNLTLNNLQLVGQGGNGGINFSGSGADDSLTLSGVHVEAVNYINPTDVHLTIENSTFVNIATGVHASSSGYSHDVTITNSSFTNCTDGSTSAIDLAGFRNIQIINTDFAENHGKVRGGALNISGSNTVVYIENCRFTDNSVHEVGSTTLTGGGALALMQVGESTLVDVTFTGNVAGYAGGTNPAQGGALFYYPYYSSSTLNLVRCSFSSNKVWDSADDGVAGVGGAMSFLAANNATVNITGGSFANNIAEVWGGAIYAREYKQLHIDGTSFEGNAAPNSGAISLLRDGEATVKNASFTGNRATAGGAGAISVSGDLEITNTQFIRNTATGVGGAISSTGEVLTLTEVDFEKNEANTGGAIYAASFTERSDLIMNTVSFTGNKATHSAGAVFAQRKVEGTDVHFVENAAEESGGGLYLYHTDANVTLTRPVFTGNEAGSQGGGIYQNQGVLRLTGGSFAENDAVDGGAVWGAQLKVLANGVGFTENTATNSGAGLFLAVADDSVLENCVFEDNVATRYRGGAVFLEDSWDVTIKGGHMHRNAANDGGALFAIVPVGLSIENVDFTGNTAQTDGGAIGFMDMVSGDHSADITGTTSFTNNVAGRNGGAIGIAWSGMTTVQIGSAVRFSGNRAAAGYLAVDDSHKTQHATHVFATVFTGGGSYGYTNHDIEYIQGLQITEYFVTYSEGAAPAQEPANQMQDTNAYEPTDTAPVQKNTYVYPGYKFAGFKIQGDNSGTLYAHADDNIAGAQTNLTILGNVTLVAQWEAGKYTLSYHANHGTLSSIRIEDLDYNEVLPLRSLSETNFARTGFTFLGWDTKADGTGTRYAADTSGNVSASITVEDDTDLYAVWSRNSYTVTYQYNNGTGNVAYATVAYGVTVPSRSVSNPGYELVGWKASTTGGLWNFARDTMPAQNLTLTAQWSKVSTPDPEPSSSSSSSSSIIVPPASSSSQASSSSSEVSSSSQLAVSSQAPAPVQSEVSSSSASQGGTYAYPGQGEPGDDDYIEPGGVFNIFGTEIPTGGPQSVGGWSMFNLLLSILALAGVGLQAVRMARSRRNNDLEAPARRAPISRVWPWVVLVTGALPMTFFLILEQFGQAIVFSKWTPLCVALFAIQILSQIMAGVLHKLSQRQGN